MLLHRGLLTGIDADGGATVLSRDRDVATVVVNRERSAFTVMTAQWLVGEFIPRGEPGSTALLSARHDLFDRCYMQVSP